MNMGSLEYMDTNKLPRVAIYLRLSRENDGSASLDTQRTAARAWLSANGYADADVTEYVDASVSGAKPLEQRNGMRRLMEARPTIVIAWKLDRYARSVSEFLRLVAWGESHGVRLATTDNTINTTTATGRMVATVLAALAEWERDLIAGRIREGQQTRRAQGRWGSGRPPFGYRIERRDGAAYLAVDDEKAALVKTAITKLINGGTVAGTAPILGLSAAQWRRLLKSTTLRGLREHKGKLILAEDGITPIRFAEPIITTAESIAARERMLDLAKGERAPRKATPMCSERGKCYRCAGRLNGGTSDKGIGLYRCKGGHVTIYAETLDAAVTEEFMRRWGNFAEYVVRLEGGNDLSEEMLEAQEQAARLGQRMATAGPLMMASLESLAEELEATYAALRAAHDPNVREVLEPTGRTLGEAWAAEPEERPRMLADVGLQVTLYPKQRKERLDIQWAIGGDDQDLIEELDAMA